MFNQKKSKNPREEIKKTTQTNVSDADQVILLRKEINTLQGQLGEANEKSKRALADYQNLQRRVQEDQKVFVKFANQTLIETIVPSLQHLTMAAENLNDPGLSMVIAEFWRSLNEQGLKKIECLGKEFDDRFMEVVEKKNLGKKVIKIVNEGYTLNGELITPAKVVMD